MLTFITQTLLGLYSFSELSITATHPGCNSITEHQYTTHL